MKQQFFARLILLSILFGVSSPVYASKSKPFLSQEEAQRYLIQHYNKGSRYYNQGSWRLAMDEFEKVVYFFPNSAEAAEAYYYLGVCYFERKEYDFANQAFSNYLRAGGQPAFFEDAVYYKFCIAEHFRCGKKRRPLTFRYFPKWMPGETMALSIYDEVVVAMPNSDLAVNALYAKAQLLQKMETFREAVETYQVLIRRFPKHEMTPMCYLKIAETYSQQSVYEFQNPDILALAELNARKFKEEFPRETKLELVEGYVQRIKEMYAKGLCDMGLFYERMGHPKAGEIYFRSSIEEFPDTRVADYCRYHLKCLGSEFKEESLTNENCETENSKGQASLTETEEASQLARMDEKETQSLETKELTNSVNREQSFAEEEKIASTDKKSFSVEQESNLPDVTLLADDQEKELPEHVRVSESHHIDLLESSQSSSNKELDLSQEHEPFVQKPVEKLLSTEQAIEDSIHHKQSLEDQKGHEGDLPVKNQMVEDSQVDTNFSYQESELSIDSREAMQKEDEASSYILHYSLMKKKPQQRRDRSGND
jgi:outer membrane protein assembly factor BamD (BamD/ComL family)